MTQADPTPKLTDAQIIGEVMAAWDSLEEWMRNKYPDMPEYDREVIQRMAFCEKFGVAVLDHIAA